MAEGTYADGGIKRRVGNYQIQFVDRELREQLVWFALTTYQAERSRQLQRGKNQTEGNELGNDIRDAESETGGGSHRAPTQNVAQFAATGENFVGVLIRHPTRFGKDQVSPLFPK